MNWITSTRHDFILFFCVQGRITAQGKLLLQDTLQVAEVEKNKTDYKFKERHVFQFDQITIFSEKIERKKGNFSNANYIYKNSLKVKNKLEISHKLQFVFLDELNHISGK